MASSASLSRHRGFTQIAERAPGDLQTDLSRTRRIYHLARRIVHPLVESFMPVTYTSEEVSDQKRRLDPTGARNRPEANDESDRRIRRVASALNIDTTQIDRFMKEARRIRLLPVAKSDDPDLASPMCSEDRSTIYVITRAAAPQVVVETGVAHGVSSAFILAAMQAGRCGRLISVELSNDPRIGQTVSQELRQRWTLRLGDSLRVLPAILADHPSIDMFVYDSWHGYRHMWREFTLIWPHLAPGGILCAHDILENNAFPRFVRRYAHEIDSWVGSVNFGLVRKRS